MKPRKKILVLCQHYWPEAFRINDITDFLIENDCEVDVLCGIPNYPKGQFFNGYSYFRNRRQIHKSIRVERAFEISRGNNTSLRIFLNYMSFPIASLFHLPRLLTRKYDKIFIYQLSPVMMSITGIILGKLKRTEITMYVLDLWPENLFSVIKVKNRMLQKIAASVSHWHYRHVDKLIVLSDKMKSKLVDVTHIPNEKIIVLPQACEKIYEQDIEDAALTKRFKGSFNILYAGNISPAQSFETIIEAAKKLRDAGLNDIRWIIVGDGMSRKWLEAEVKKANLDNCFVFEGQQPIENIPKYNSIADVLVGCLVKSDLLEATIPAKVMSYLASGKPMVLAMDGEVQELVNKLIHCGIAGPTGDAEALISNIQEIYKMTPNQRKIMGERGRSYHLQHFERNLILRKLHNFIFNLN